MTSPFGFTAKTDGVDDHLAAHVNNLQSAADILAKAPSGFMYNGRIAVSVSSSDLTVAIKTYDNNDPSASDPVIIRIGNTIRLLTTALSVTKNDGTNWFSAGSAEHATLEHDYFVYIIWNTAPATDILDLGFSRLPYARVFGDCVSTTTSEKYMANANGTPPANSDDVALIGRFAATLGASATYLWSVPTFTTSNLIQEPVNETRWLTWTPAHARSGGAYTNLPTQNLAKYMVIGRQVFYQETHTQHATPGSSGYQTVTVPFLAANNSSGTGFQMNDAYALAVLVASATLAGLRLFKYDATQEATASKQYGAWGNYEI